MAASENECSRLSCELGEVARKMLGMGGRDKDGVENWTIIYDVMGTWQIQRKTGDSVI